LTLDIAGFPWLRRLAETVKATKTVAGAICHRLVFAAVSNGTVDHFLCQIYCVCVCIYLFIFYLILFFSRMFEAVPVQIHNLGEAPQSEYKLVPSTACMSDSFNSIISSLR
jgi:hypothetical protein